MKRLRVPGDKSISHRALMIAALGSGRSRVRSILRSADVESTAAVLRALGANIPSLDADEVIIEGVGLRGLRQPSVALDCGNSGTTARLISGIIAALPIEAELVGDASLSRRPMGRIASPLGAMGAKFTLPPGGGLPLRIRGGTLKGITSHPDVASAQVKTAILFAGLVADVPVEVHEPAQTRDHTERMLRARGVDIRCEDKVVSLLPSGRLDAGDMDIAGDPSSAMFIAGLAAMGGVHGGTVHAENVGVNPARVGGFRALRRMGASITYEETMEQGGEPVATVVCGAGDLQGIVIPPAEVPGLIDELPLIACVAARANGETRVTGAGELRVKESDRITVVVDNLRAIGVDAEELPDGFIIRGSEKPLKGRVLTHGDHRIAMAFGVLGAIAGNELEIDDPSCCVVSWPSFWDDLRALTS